ncbi:hypothetical protein RhiJN_00563 [Ceratobasidium sp. AG-Ba]|nr:hypothetical protein RhiJN_00563 [Ceratobasidium sp. AG-Ba]
MTPSPQRQVCQITGIRYDPRDAKVVVDHTPKSYGENSVYHINSHGAMAAIDSIATKTLSGAAIASLEARITPNPSTLPLPSTTSLWPSGGTADGSPPIPSNALNGHPILGRQRTRPESDRAMQATKLFVIEEWVGSEVKHLVKEVQKVKKMSCTPHLIRRLEEWEKEGKEKATPKWWKTQRNGSKNGHCSKGGQGLVPRPDISKTYQEVLKEIPFGEVIDLVEKERWSKRELLDWLDQKAWDKGNEDLSVDMADLLLEPLEEDEEWVKLKEEVWGAEAPNGDHNIKSHLPPADF